MPKKLQFQVVHVSGYDNDHGPKELEVNLIEYNATLEYNLFCCFENASSKKSKIYVSFCEKLRNLTGFQ